MSLSCHPTLKFSAVLFSLAGALPAQAPTARFVPSGGANAAGRFTIPNNGGGEVLNRIGANEYRGVGQSSLSATLGDVVGIEVVLQTRSTFGQAYYLIIRRDAAARPGTPDPSAAGSLLRTANLVSPASTGNTQVWRVTATLQRPARVLPSAQTYHVGVGLTSTVGVSPLLLQGNFFAIGNAPRAPVGNPAGVVQGAQVTGVRGSVSVGLVLDRPALIPAARVPNSGAALPGYHGLYPDVTARSDGLEFVHQALGRSGQVVTLVSGVPTGPALRVGTIGGFVHIDLANVVVLDAQPLRAGGQNQIQPSFMAPSRLRGIRGRLQFQAVSSLGAGLELSNAVQVSF